MPSITQTTTSQQPSNPIPSSAAGDCSLGNTYENCVPLEETDRQKRFRLQNAARDLLPGERVCNCLRHLAPVHHHDGGTVELPTHVQVWYNQETNKAHYRGLQVCGSVWTCPVCAGKISEKRREELQRAVANSKFYKVLLVTYTLRHHKSDKLTDLLDTLLGAFRKLKSGRFWQDFKLDYGWVGDVRSLETTWGVLNGWHPHIHALMFVDKSITADEIDQLTGELRERWQHVLWSLGGDAEYEIGVDVKSGNKYVQEYLAKYGKMPERDLDQGKGWDGATEVTKAVVKNARTPDGRTPWALLDDYSMDGDEEAGRLFQEYTAAMKGRNQLVWSRDLKGLLAIEDTPDDVETLMDDDADLFILVDKTLWAALKRRRKREWLLSLVERTQGNRKAVVDWLDRIARMNMETEVKARGPS